jgi:hypothetical protein
MASASHLPSSSIPPDARIGGVRALPRPTEAGPRQAYRAALGSYKATRLAAIRAAQADRPLAVSARGRASGSADELTEYLDSPSAVEALVKGLPAESLLALSFVGVTETTEISFKALSHGLSILNVEPKPAILRLLELGLVAVEHWREPRWIDDFPAILDRANVTSTRFLVHPGVIKEIRTLAPTGGLPEPASQVSQIRESDGLEATLRLGALWQQVDAEPLRQTQQGTLYKRDSDRIRQDSVLSGAITDALKPLPELPLLWMALARAIGLVEYDSAGERLLAAAPEFWTEHAVHFPQMIAAGWLRLRSWQELDGEVRQEVEANQALPLLRTALLLLLSALAEDEWVVLDDLAAHLTARFPGWSQVTLSEESPEVIDPPGREVGARGRPRAKLDKQRAPSGSKVLEAILLGAAYPLGLVRVAEERSGRRLAVQVSRLGRYVLAMGSAPLPRQAFEHFLFVQPNFEVIAYRQGLTPQLVGVLSRFAAWTQIGSALELKLTRESIVRGLDRDLTPESILELLARHSQRPLPPGVIDAVKNWSARRERVTFYQAATVLEFGSAAERDQAVALWPDSDVAGPPLPVAERFLLVEDGASIPFDRLRMTSSRDYRRPPEVCVKALSDGVTLRLDPTRADLLVDAELERFADPAPQPDAGRAAVQAAAPRSFVISAATILRAFDRGLSPRHLTEWFAKRTGEEIPPAVELLLAATTTGVPRLLAIRTIVLNVSSAALLDGLIQHPSTSPLLGNRLGPTSITISEDQLAPLQAAMKELGIKLDLR